MQWGQFKADNPRVSYKGKVIKYEQPKGQPSKVIYLAHSEIDWPAIQDDPSQPIFITEGAKKAGCLMSLGFAAIAVPGVDNSAPKDKWGQPRLIPELKAIAQPGRQIVFVYDSDEKPRTQKHVYNAIKRAGQAFQDEGCEVSWVNWDKSLGKGIDDVCASQGADIVIELVSNPIRLKTFEEKFYCVTKSIDQHVFEQLFDGGKGDWVVIHQGFYCYTRQGWWEYYSDPEIEKAIAHFLMKCYKEKPVRGDNTIQVRKVHTVASDKAVTSSFKFCRKALAIKPPSESRTLRCFANNTVNVQTGDILRHNPNHFLTSHINAPYESNTGCPEVFLAFVESSFGSENLELIRAAINMTLDPSAPWGYFIYLLGQSGGGKGTLIRFVSSLFDQNAVRSSQSLSDIVDSEKRHQHLKGIDLFVLPDMGGYISGSGLHAFYELVDNGPMSGRALYCSSSYQAQWNVRFWLGSVDPLNVENGGAGWERRAITIPVKPRSGPADTDLSKKLKSVRAAIIAWALAMDKEERDNLLKNSAQSSDSARAIAREVAKAGDPVKEFVDMCLRPAETVQDEMETTYAYNLYRQFAEKCGYSTLSISSFRNRLRKVLGEDLFEERRKLSRGKDGLNYRRNEWKPANFKVRQVLGILNQEGHFQLHMAVEGGLQLIEEHSIGKNSTEHTDGTEGTAVPSPSTRTPEKTESKGTRNLSTNGTGSTCSSSPLIDSYVEKIIRPLHPASICEGATVKKRGKTGWRGVVTGRSGTNWMILWFGDKKPVLETPDILELATDNQESAQTV